MSPENELTQLKLIVLLFLITTENSEASDKIVGGVKASRGEFPWLVTLTTQREFCAATIISDSFLMTAAHCALEKSSRYTVTAGVYNIKSPSISKILNSISEIFVHPDYSSTNGVNDIALMKLTKPFEFNKKVYAIDLVPSDYVPEGDAVVAGWGVESQEGTIQPDILKKISIPIVPYGHCKAFYDSSENQTPIEIHDSVICAGGDGKSACFGDSGGPLMCQSSESASGYVCCGTVSAGAKCGHIGVYTRVSYFRDWIESIANI